MSIEFRIIRLKLMEYIGWALLILTIILFKFADRLMDNIIRAKGFLLIYGFIGLMLSIGFIYLIQRKLPGFFSESTKRGRVGMGYLLGLWALFTFGAALYNMETGRENTREIRAVVVKKVENNTYRTKYVFLDMATHQERFQPEREQWAQLISGDTVALKVGRGNLGFDYIFQFGADPARLRNPPD